MQIREDNPDNAPPVDIEDTVHALFEMIWTMRLKKKPAKVGKEKKKSKKKAKEEFPELIPCIQDDEDSD